ncbi:hypothetical protein PMAYCL1PPCAC_10188, partial [Pristionchus mayeri]
IGFFVKLMLTDVFSDAVIDVPSIGSSCTSTARSSSGTHRLSCHQHLPPRPPSVHPVVEKPSRRSRASSTGSFRSRLGIFCHRSTIPKMELNAQLGLLLEKRKEGCGEERIEESGEEGKRRLMRGFTSA